MRNVKCSYCEEYRNEWCEKVIDSPHPDILRDCQYFHEAKTRWIPVSERLPEIRQEVLLCDGLWYFIAEYRGEVWYIDGVFKNSEDLDYDGFAWMPLPDPYNPYKEGQDETD